MTDLIEALKKGIDLYSFFYSKYYGPIKYRPLTNLEISMVLKSSLKGKSKEMREFIKDMRLKLIPKKEIDISMLDDVSDVLDIMDAWIVYHAVKDFQEENWQHENDGIPLGVYLLRSPDSYLEVSRFAEDVMRLSTRPVDEVKSFIKTGAGEILAETTWKLGYPLTDKLWKLTNLQLSFLIESSLERTKKNVNTVEELGQESQPTARAMTDFELNIIKKAEEIRKKITGDKRFR